MKIALLVLMLLAPGAVMAQSEVCDSSFTVVTVTVASHTATLVDSALLVMSDRKWVEVQNVSTDSVRCSHDANVTTATGKLLAANGGSFDLSLKDVGFSLTRTLTSPFTSKVTGRMGIYCIGTGTNVTSKVALSQCK